MKNRLLILVSMFAAFTACQTELEVAEEESDLEVASESIKLTESQYANLKPELANMMQIPFSSEIEVTGMVDVPPENIAMVSAAVDGIVKTITHNVLPGKYVKKGAVLAVAHSMELVQLQQDYLDAYLKSEVLKQEYDRQISLINNGAGIERKLQEAESALKLNNAKASGLEAKLKIVNSNLEKLKRGEIRPQLYIYAPISGFIKHVNVNTGTNFGPGDTLFEIISKDHLHVELKVFEKEAGLLKEHQKVVFSGQGLEENTTGSIFLISKSFEEESKAINVHVHLDEDRFEENLIPGQYLKGRIQVDERATHALPESAIIREASGNFVLIQKANANGVITFEKVAVETGANQNGMIAIISPSELKNVVISKVHLISGMAGGE